VLPHDLAGPRIDCDDALRQHGQNDLPAAVVDDPGRAASRRLAEPLALPEDLTCILVQGRQRRIRAARRADHPLPVHEHGLGKAELRLLAAEPLQQIHGFEHLALGRIERDQLAESGHEKYPGPVNSRCAASARYGRTTLIQLRPVRHFPFRRSVQTEREQEPLLLLVHPRDIDSAIGHRSRGVSLAKSLGGPGQFRPALRPLLQQPGLGELPVPRRPAKPQAIRPLSRDGQSHGHNN